MFKIIAILMKRDGLSKKEATQFLDDVLKDVEDAIANGDWEDAEDIWMGDTGLEVDYLMEVLM